MSVPMQKPPRVRIFALVVLLMGIGVAGASATTTVITNVIPDAAQTEVFIYGQNFCTSPAPEVYMFVPPSVGAAQLLTVTSFSASLITAKLPAGAAAGIYLFFVNCGGVFNGFAAVLDRPGVAGATGSTGTTGAPGAMGAPGATGATGSGANVSVAAPLASTGGATPILSLPGVRIDAAIPGNPGSTAIGSGALMSSTGIDNTASGTLALFANTTGSHNTASGFEALFHNTSGFWNTATGNSALLFNSNGSYNTAGGHTALYSNGTGFYNTASGYEALHSNTIGDNNTAVGRSAGWNATTGSNNIYLGANVQGWAGEANTMYLGKVGTQTRTFIAGVRGITTGVADAIPVVIDSTGQLGTVSSSRRFKEDIRDMGDSSRALMRLRPVTFRYRQAYADGSTPIQYGLIAEEVAQVYPSLVVHSADGQIETVQYDKVNAMLLNEVQQQHGTIDGLTKELADLAARVRQLETGQPATR